MEGFESFVGVDFWTCIFTFCNLIILVFVLKKLLFKPVKNMIDKRQSEIDNLYEDAGQKQKEADDMKSMYQEKLEKANAESEEILKQAVRKAQLREEEILKEAQEKAAVTVRHGKEQVELEKKRAINEIKNEVSDMAVDIASAIIERDIDKDEHEKLIDSFIDGLGDDKL